MTPTTRDRSTCAACRAVGHTVGRCTARAAIAYWAAAAQRHRAEAAAHREEARHLDAGDEPDEAAYQRRAAELDECDAVRCERKRARVAAVAR